MHRKYLIPALCATALALATMVAWWAFAPGSGMTSADAADQTQASRLREKSVEATHAGAGRAWSGRYALDYSATVEVKSGMETRTLTTLAARGDLIFAAVPGADHAGWLAVRAKPVRLSANELALQVSDMGTDRAPVALDSDFAVQFGADGRVQDVRFAAGTPSGIQAMWAGVARDLQFVPAADRAVATWRSDESDLNDSFAASYARQPDGTVRKTWSNRASDAGSADQPARPAMSQASGEAAYAFEAGRLAWMRLEKAGGAVATAGSPMPQYRSNLQLRYLAAADAAWATRIAPGRLVAFDGEVKPRRKPTIAALPLADFEARVAAASGPRKVSDRNDLKRHLVASFRQDPQKISDVRERLASGELHEPVERAYIEALVMDDSPAAQTAMAQLIAAEATDRRLLLQLLSGAAFFETPTQAWVSAIEAVTADRKQPQRANAALLTLGAAVKAKASYDPKDAEETGRRLIGRATPRLLGPTMTAPEIKVATTVGEPPADWPERAAWVDAIGNAGLVEAAPMLAKVLLEDTTETVRKCAAQALRFLPAKIVKPTIIQSMALEDSIYVRQALLLSVRTIGPEALLDVATKALRHDKSELVRLAAAYTVAVWAMDAPALNGVLKLALETEKSGKVQESLKNYLQHGRTEPPFVPVGQTPGGQP